MTASPTAGAGWHIRRARREELSSLNAIEREAGRRFDAIPWLADVPEVLAPGDGLAAAYDRGQVWVAAATADERLVGFAYADLLDGAVHLEEIDVVPDWGGRGIGRALVATVCADAAARGLAAVTLTTFRDVPWNAPMYARLGFRVVEHDALTPSLAALVAYEARRGLPEDLRVVMRREVRAGD
jgi:GNAT superfamily N-acetyltransferase